jgi:hypothetical protein
MSFENKLELLDKLLKIVYEIQEHQSNPVELSKLPLPRDSRFERYANYDGLRPMAKYSRQHFMNLIGMLNTYKRAAPETMGRRAPERTGVEFVSQELDLMNRASGRSEYSGSHGSRRSHGSRHSTRSKNSSGSRHSHGSRHSRGSWHSRSSRRSQSSN